VSLMQWVCCSESVAVGIAVSVHVLRYCVVAVSLLQ